MIQEQKIAQKSAPLRRSAVQSILLDSPSSSPHRVSFDFVPKIKEISCSNGQPTEKKPLKFEVKDRNIIINKNKLKFIKAHAKKYSALISSKQSIVLKYRRNEDMETDLRAMGLKPRTYVENKLIVYNLGYKETESSVEEYFSSFSEVEKVVLEKNKKGFCTGKGTVTFTAQVNTNQEFRLGGRLLRIERIKKQIINRNRLFISHMNKNLKISDLRKILKDNGFTPKNIRIDLQDGRNKGFGFVEFERFEDSERFAENFKVFSERIGEKSFVQKSKEKPMNK